MGDMLPTMTQTDDTFNSFITPILFGWAMCGALLSEEALGARISNGSKKTSAKVLHRAIRSIINGSPPPVHFSEWPGGGNFGDVRLAQEYAILLGLFLSRRSSDADKICLIRCYANIQSSIL